MIPPLATVAIIGGFTALALIVGGGAAIGRFIDRWRS
jgi:hypothetical protein